MMMYKNEQKEAGKDDKRIKAARKEYQRLLRQEEKLRKAAAGQKTPEWKLALEKKIPPKACDALKRAFCRAFSHIFEKGTGIIEKSYSRTDLTDDFKIRDYAVNIKGTSRELKNMRAAVQKDGLKELAVTTAEGVGLGLFGIGLPDIVVFSGMLLRGIYKAASGYGVDYHLQRERYLILKMMEAAVSRGEAFAQCDKVVDEILTADDTTAADDSGFQQQMEQTAGALAMDMLLMKFIQGLPVIGVAGGMANPVFYHKIMQYVNMKFYKRYLQKMLNDSQTVGEQAWRM